MIITIDGPSGVGKSTLAKNLAKELGIAYLDTGAMYRSLGLRLGASAADMSDEKLAHALQKFHYSLKKEDDNYVLYCNEEAIGEEVRTDRAARMASTVGTLPLVRKALQTFQQEIAKENSLVAEGRDMGTKVFPHAPVKFFLDASAEERANRRFKEFEAKGQECCYDEILKAIEERDIKDRDRVIDPLRPAEDAILIDTSFLNIEQVFEVLITRVEDYKAMKEKTENVENSQEFTHLASDGSMKMVAVEHKAQTMRRAGAEGFVRMSEATIALLRENALPKGDVLSVAKVAGIMAAKQTANLIPLCHPLLLSFIDVNFVVHDNGVEITSEVRTCHGTGVEMEAIIAVQIAASTIYDMVKAVQKDMTIENIRLVFKEGGKSGYYLNKN